MKPFEINRILVPLDFSGASLLALEFAVHMSKKFSADMTLLHVMETMAFTSGEYAMTSLDIETEVQRSVDKRLNTALGSIKGRTGGKVNLRSETGRIYKSIIGAAGEEKADLIVMGTHGASGFQEFFIGTNTYRVVSEAPCPVLSVRTDARKNAFKNIVLPIDDSLHSRQKVIHALRIAKMYDSRVHILGLLIDDIQNDTAASKRFTKKVELVQDYFKKHEVSNTTQFLIGKNPATLTMNYATKEEADLIIIMTEQEPGVSGLFMGPYAQQVVNHSSTPVLSISPDFNPDTVDMHGYGW